MAEAVKNVHGAEPADVSANARLHSKAGCVSYNSNRHRPEQGAACDSRSQHDALRRVRSPHILELAFGRYSLVLFGGGFNAIVRIVRIIVGFMPGLPSHAGMHAGTIRARSECEP